VRRLLVWSGAALALPAALAIYLWRSTPPEDRAPHPFNQDRNAVWLEHRWLERPHPVAELDALFEALHRRGVLYAFPHLIPFDASGRLPPHSREQMRTLLESARRSAPGMRLLPWVGGLRKGYRRTRQGSVDLADLAQRGRLAAECRGLMDEGFDGVHLNVEPVNDGNVEYLALLRALRTAVGDKGLLSVSAIRPGPLAIPGAPNFFWSLDYYRRVASVVDQVAIMSYDTGLPTAGLYRRYVSYAASSVTRALAKSGTRARVLLGVPTYDETGLMHRVRVENPGNALLGVIAGLRGVGGGGTFEGVALYAEWTTDEQEWQTYERLWRGQGAERDRPLASSGAR
jgi:hypothetical protein